MGLPEPNTVLRLFRIFESGATTNPLDEILALIEEINPSVDQQLIIAVHQDIQDIFSGYYPGFKENANKYHNLRHTHGVALAVARLFHGLTVEGYSFSSGLIVKGMLCAYFHDTGLILRSFDKADTGAEFTKYHEARSISSLFKYLESYPFDDAMKLDCGSIIRCTNLELDINTIDFSSEEIKIAGQILGTADILAQMADRYYLEQLPFLFQEHRAGGLQAYETAYELLKDTTHFYYNFILNRFERQLGGVSRSMRTHFKSRWNLNRDLYVENIESNIHYLESIIGQCREDLQDLYLYLRRRPPFRS